MVIEIHKERTNHWGVFGIQVKQTFLIPKKVLDMWQCGEYWEYRECHNCARGMKNELGAG